MSAPTQSRPAPIRLHIDAIERREGWTILDTLPHPAADIIGNCQDLSRFADESVEEIYASHFYEHLSYMHELVPAPQEAFRVLKRGGLLRIVVPDLEVLCRLFLEPTLTFKERTEAMRMIMGGQMDEFDYHKGGLWFELLDRILRDVGFANVQRVQSFGLFKDTTEAVCGGRRISHNVTAYKS